MKRAVVKKQHNSKMCLVCGKENKLGLHTSFYEMDTQEVVAICTPKEEHQSYPGIVHGGISATLLDETIGRAISILHEGAFGMTLELNTQYKKPVPVGEEIKIIGRITKHSRRIFEGTGEIILKNGDVAVTATGKYMKLPIERIASEDFTEEDWFIDESDEDPKELEW